MLNVITLGQSKDNTNHVIKITNNFYCVWDVKI